MMHLRQGFCYARFKHAVVIGIIPNFWTNGVGGQFSRLLNTYNASVFEVCMYDF
jgi:hypothetical protein